MLQKIKKMLRKYINRQFVQKKRMNDLANLPKTILQERHFSECRLIADRNTLLKKVGTVSCAVELGVNRGEFSQRILETCRPEQLHLVDVWNSKRYHDGLYEGVVGKFKTEIQEGGIIVHRKFSTEAAEDFSDGSINFLYIDTDHTYKTTKEELRRYQDKMAPEGIIAGHDFITGNWVTAFKYGVIDAVYEFCAEYEWAFVFITMDTSESISFALKKLRNSEN